MRNFIISLFSIFLANLVPAQVRTYQVQNSSGLSMLPNAIKLSNDGNMLISNSEPNVNVAYSHVIKARPNGDTIFIKSTDAEYFYVTGLGNILSNNTEYEIVLQNYTKSYVTMRDKNFNMKWQIDLTPNFSGSGTTISPPVVESFLELNSNRFICTVNSYTGSPMTLAGGAAIEFDSTGAIHSTYTSPVYGKWLLAAKFNHKWISYNENRLMIADSSFNNAVPIRISSPMPEISAVHYYNHKIYIASKINQTGNKAMLSCMDTNFVVGWNKIIQPNDLTANNFIKDVLFSSNKLICQYQDDSLSYILNFDLSGNLLSTHNVQLDDHEYTTNLALLNDSLYVVKNLAGTPSGEALIKMDNAGNYPCSSSAAFAVSNYTYGLITVQDSLRPTSFTYSLSSVVHNAYSYSITLSNGCIISSVRSLDEKGIVDIYPNPNNGTLNIKSGSFKEDALIKIYNTIGDVVFKETIRSLNSSFNIEHLSNGIYFYEILLESQIIKNDKIVVIK